jgi:hypothetical protein
MPICCRRAATPLGRAKSPPLISFVISDQANDLLDSSCWLLSPFLITDYCLLLTDHFRITLPNAVPGCVQVRPKAWLTDRPASVV